MDLGPQAKVRSRKERRPGEETRPLSPALISRERAPGVPKMDTDREPQGTWGPSGPLTALPAVTFHLKERKLHT